MPLHFSLKHEHTADATLEIRIEGLDSFMSLKRHITVLLSDITALETFPHEINEPFRLIPRVGVHVPGVMSKGRVFGAEGNSFYYFGKTEEEHVGANTSAPSRVLGISLDKDSADAQYVRLVIEVPEGSTAAEWKAKIEDAKRIV